MRTMRPAIAIDARNFGKRFVLHDAPAAAPSRALGADARLFAATFLVGFVFVSVLLA